MSVYSPPSDSVHWYMNELTSRLVADTRIPNDRFHLGKLILQGLKDAPNFMLQIDAGTGESETCGSVLKRSTQCAVAFQKLGLKCGDVIALVAPNNIHLCIPMYAALYLGISVACVDTELGLRELQETFEYQKPKIVFCLPERVNDIQKALEGSQNDDTHIITFGKTHNIISFTELLTSNEINEQLFKATDFDPDETIAILISTSGTTGLPKSAVVTHKNIVMAVPYMWATFQNFPTPTRLTLALSPIQWYSAMFQFVFSPILRHTRVHTSIPITTEHICFIVNKYRPTLTMANPSTLAVFVQNQGKCDISCFELIMSAGSPANKTLFKKIREISPDTRILDIYGMSELAGLAFFYNDSFPDSVGSLAPHFKHRIINIETMEDIKEPNICGELWLKGPTVFKGYYNKPDETNQTIVEDGWMKTGDIFYKDIHGNFYFVERLKMLLKYKNHQISPLEIEKVISKHPGVLEVAVSGVADEIDGELPVAFIVPQEGSTVSAQEIKDLLKDQLSDSKQLRGGVIFVKALPLTSTSKVNRQKLKLMASELLRE